MKVDTPGLGEVLTYFPCLLKVCHSFKVSAALKLVTIYLCIMLNCIAFGCCSTVNASNYNNKDKNSYVRSKVLTVVKNGCVGLHGR